MTNLTMIRILLALQAFACVADDPVPVKAMTYNIAHGVQSSLEEIADIIDAEGATIVALQEVDQSTERTNYDPQTATLASLTGMQGFYFQANHDYKVGIAVLLHPDIQVLSTWNQDLTTILDTNPRIVAIMHLSVNGEEFFLFNVHMSYTDDWYLQMHETAQLVGYVVSGGYPVIVMGDFNRSYRDRIPLTDCDPRPTYPSTGPGRSIDAVLVDGFYCHGTYTTGGVASDHLAVVATLD